MLALRFAVVLLLASAATTCAPCVLAQNAEVAVSVEINEGPVIGHTIHGMLVANNSCAYRDHYHFELTPEAELRLHGSIVCGKLNASGGELICFLSPEATCEARKDYSGGDGAHFSADGTGVRADGKFYAWNKPELAAHFVERAKSQATANCTRTLARQAQEARGTPPDTPTPETIEERTVCKPMLERICTSARGSAATLDNEKDISVLCHR